MVLNKKSKFDNDLSKDCVEVERYRGKDYWPLVESYIRKDVDILYKGLIELEKLYNSKAYSIVDKRYCGLPSIAHDHFFKFIPKGTFEPFTKEMFERWKCTYTGGIVEVLDLNKEQRRVHVYDINGLYTYVRLKYKFPVGKPVEIKSPDVSELPKLFGLIKANVYNDGSVPIGIPAKDGASFNRYKGSVFYQGTTEELKSLIRQGVKVESISEVLHYSRRKSGKVYYMDTDSFDTDIELPDSMIGSETGKLKYEGSFDRSIYLGRKQYYLVNTSTGLVKVGCKGYDSSLLTLEDWERAFKGDETLLKFWQFKKENYEEIRKIDVEKVFKKSLNGRIYREDGTSEPLEISFDNKSRLKASLSDTELDVPVIRLGGYRGSKVPSLRGWTKGALEKRSIREILEDKRMLNYSVRTGSIGDNTYLVVIDIDLKGSKVGTDVNSLKEKLKVCYKNI